MKATFLAVVLLQVYQATGQDDVGKYFAGSQTYPAIVVKFDPFILINGDLSGFVEVNINERVAVEGSIGVLLPYYVPELFDFVSDYETRDVKSGMSYSVSTRLYSKKREAPEGPFGGLTWRQRIYRTNYDYNSNNKDILLIWGYQFIPHDFVTADFYTGFGVRMKKIKYNELDEDGNSVVPLLVLGVKIGLKLK